MKMQTSFAWWRAPARLPARRSTPDWVTATVDSQRADDTPPPAGCGWFDSSHELHAGLLVTEHATPDSVANEVPLGWWLDWQLPGPLPGGARRIVIAARN